MVSVSAHPVVAVTLSTPSLSASLMAPAPGEGIDWTSVVDGRQRAASCQNSSGTAGRPRVSIRLASFILDSTSETELGALFSDPAIWRTMTGLSGQGTRVQPPRRPNDPP